MYNMYNILGNGSLEWHVYKSGTLRFGNEEAMHSIKSWQATVRYLKVCFLLCMPKVRQEHLSTTLVAWRISLTY